jgi:hypothetical protein
LIDNLDIITFMVTMYLIRVLMCVAVIPIIRIGLKKLYKKLYDEDIEEDSESIESEEHNH